MIVKLMMIMTITEIMMKLVKIMTMAMLMRKMVVHGGGDDQFDALSII